MGNILNIINSNQDFYNVSDECKEIYIDCMDGPFFSGEIKNYFKFTIVNTDSIRENTNYIYPIQCRSVDGIFSGLHYIPNKVVELVNQNKCKVIFSYESEGDFPLEDFNTWFYWSKFILKERIDLDNVYIFSNDFKAEERNNTQIKFFSSIHFLDSISHSFNKIVEKQNGVEELSEFPYNFIVKKSNEIDLNKKTKHFLSYLRNCARPHRVALASYFQHHNLWDTNNISFLKISWDNDECLYLPEYLIPAQKELDKKEIVEIDTHHLERKTGFGTIFSSNWENYQETFLSVVSETCYDNKKNDCLYISEKSLKPIMNLHPFIIFSTPYFLKNLKELGFKTFNGFIDESYDDEQCPKRRLELIFTELDKFKEKSIKELKDWWIEIIPILEHNQNRLIELGKSKTEKIKLLENLYD